MSSPPPEQPDVRISDADRERAAARLQQAMAEGRISLVELEERLGVVYGARFAGELVEPLADLPHAGGELVVAASTDVVATTDPTEPMVLRNSSDTLRRRGDWSIPARLQVFNRSGAVVLDFCDAPLRHPVVQVEVDNRSGTVKLLVPDDATADVDGVTNGSGAVRGRVDARRRAGSPHFVLVGRNRSGTVVVRRRYQFLGYPF